MKIGVNGDIMSLFLSLQSRYINHFLSVAGALACQPFGLPVWVHSQHLKHRRPDQEGNADAYQHHFNWVGHR